MNHPSLPLVCCIAGLWCAAVPAVHSQTRTWDGGGNSNNWSGPGGNGNNNWDGNNRVVANGSDLVFAGAVRTTPNNNFTTFTSGGITFANGASAFILGGNAITLGGNVTNRGSALQTIDMNLLLSATRTFNADTGDLAAGGVISGSFGINKTGLNQLFLRAANTHSGTTSISGGRLFANNASGSATGTGAVSVAAGGTLGGSGFIAPSGSNGISVSGVLAPGGALNTIGTLTLNMTGTTGIVAMNSGASFEFQLGLPGGSITAVGVSDLLTLAGAAANDFAFSGNNVNFLNSGAVGFYKLFDTSNNNANTWTGLTFDATTGVVSSGLGYSNLASGLSGAFIVGTAGNGGTTGDIYFRVVPEPGAALLGGLSTLLLLRRRRTP